MKMTITKITVVTGTPNRCYFGKPDGTFKQMPQTFTNAVKETHALAERLTKISQLISFLNEQSIKYTDGWFNIEAAINLHLFGENIIVNKISKIKTQYHIPNLLILTETIES